MVSLVNRPPPVSHELAAVIAQIRDLLQRDWVVRVLHTLREGNSCADFLAKAGANQMLNFCLIVEPPQGLLVSLAQDAADVLVVRP